MAAVLAPQVLATFRALFKGKQRATVFGVSGAVAGLAAAVGVTLGGVLTQANVIGLGWRAGTQMPPFRDRSSSRPP
jgi:MFS family permease